MWGRRLGFSVLVMSGMLLAVSPVPSTRAAASEAPHIPDILREYSELERKTLARLTALEAARVRDPAVSDRIAATRAELAGIAELQTSARYVLRQEEMLAAKEAERRDKAARLARLERTLELLRLDNEVRARGYLDRLDASIAPTDAAVRAFARSQAAIDRELDAFEAREYAAFLNETNASATAKRRIDEEVERNRAQLRKAYDLAAAAKRLIDDDSWMRPKVSSNSSTTDLQKDDIAAVEAHSPSFAALRSSVAAIDEERAAAEAELKAEEAALARLGLTAPTGPEGGENASTAVDSASITASEALASASATQVERLIATVRHVLALNAAAQLDASRRGGSRHRAASSSEEPGESSLRSWTQSPGDIEAEIASIEAQRTSLERARRALEEELARRAARAGRLAVIPRPGDTGGAPLPPGTAALVAAAEAAGGVGPGATPTELRHGPVIEELLREDGIDPREAASVNLGTGVHGPGVGGGLGARAGCAFCAARRNIARLEDAISGLRSDLRECEVSPDHFKPNCAARLRFQVERLSGDLQRRRLVRGDGCLQHSAPMLLHNSFDAPAQMLAAEQVELERMATSLAASAQACEASSPATDPNVSVAPRSCLLAERRAIASLRRSIDLELESRLRMTDEAQLKRQYACLWQHRALPLTSAVARVVTSPADMPTDPDEGSASTIAAGPLDSLVAAARNSSASAMGEGGRTGSAGGSNVARARTSRAARLLELCAALTAPALVAGGGEALHSCLCAEAEEAQEFAKQAAAAAQTRAAAAANAAKRASQEALREALARTAAQSAAREAAKERLFARLQAHPELARLVSEAALAPPVQAALPSDSKDASVGSPIGAAGSGGATDIASGST